MTKLLAPLMALAMVFALCACGTGSADAGEEDDLVMAEPVGALPEPTVTPTDAPTPPPAPEPLAIRITLDNWQDYFEIRPQVKFSGSSNAFGEETVYPSQIAHYISLKEEYRNGIEAGAESRVAFMYSLSLSDRYYHSVEDIENGSFYDERYYDPVTDCDAVIASENDYMADISASGFVTNRGEYYMSAGEITNVEMTRVEGVIYLMQ